MSKVRIIPVLIVAAMLFSSCDFVRTILGKPTSKDIERMRIEQLEQQAQRQRELDSLQRVRAAEEAAEAERLAALELLKKLNDRYYVIIGSFKMEENATRMYSLLEKKGYTPKRIAFQNGYDVVSVKSFNSYRAAREEIEILLEYEFCPDDVWIYDKESGLHVE